MQESSKTFFSQPPNYWCKQVFQETQENVGGGEVASVKLAYYRPLHVYISCTVLWPLQGPRDRENQSVVVVSVNMDGVFLMI